MDVLSLVPFSRKLYLTPLEQVTKKRKIFILFLQAHQSGQFEDPSILQPHLLTLEGVCVCVCVLVDQCVQLFAPAWTVACQAPLFMGFSRQKYWSRLPFPSPGDLPDLGILPQSSALQADSLPSEP